MIAIAGCGLLHLAGGRPGLDAPTDDLVASTDATEPNARQNQPSFDSSLPATTFFFPTGQLVKTRIKHLMSPLR